MRFCAKLGFELDPGTRRAAEELAPSLKLVSAERIQTELVKLLVSPHPEMISLAWECGITAQVLPEFDLIMEAPQNNPHHIFSVGEHTIRTLMAIRADRILRLTMLFHDMGKPSCSLSAVIHSIRILLRRESAGLWSGSGRIFFRCSWR